jgi:hypothetical protein
MKDMDVRKEGRPLEVVRSTRRTLATGIIALAALFLMGFVTEASAQGSSSIVVRARGTSGGESITLRVDNSNVATWTLSTSYQSFDEPQWRHHCGLHQ